jgi:hypothetical protein
MMARAGERHTIGQAARLAAGRFLPLLAACACIAVLPGVCADAAAQESYGRLFFSADERHTMNDMRNDWVEPPPVEVTGDTQAAPVVDVISFNGKVERSGSGSSTIWINGRPVLTGSRTIEGIRVEPGRGTSAETLFVLPPSGAGETNFSLKAGQKIAVQSGKVLDSYEVRAAQDAESVFATQLPAATAPPSDGTKSPTEVGTPADPGGS